MDRASDYGSEGWGFDSLPAREQRKRLFADAKDVLEATAFLSGTGTNEPKGVLRV
jgi:hypothetical protein